MENVEDFDAIQKRLRDEIAPFTAFARGGSAKKDTQSGSSNGTPQNGSGQGQMPDFSSILAQLS